MAPRARNPRAKKPLEPLTVESTLYLSKQIHKVSFKRRAPKAIQYIQSYAKKSTYADEVVIDPSVNKAVWAQGIRRVPKKIRITLSRKQTQNKAGENIWVTYVTHMPVPRGGWKGLGAIKL